MSRQSIKILSFLQSTRRPVDKTWNPMPTLIHSRLFPSHVRVEALKASRRQRLDVIAIEINKVSVAVQLERPLSHLCYFS